MTERTVRFNFTERRAARAEQKRKADEQAKALQERTESEAEKLKEAVAAHFSAGEFAASRDGATVRIERKGTGKVASIKALGDKRYGIKTEDDLTFRISGGPGGDISHETPFTKELDEGAMMDWILDWSEA